MSTKTGIRNTLIVICLFMASMVGLLVHKMMSHPMLTAEQLRDHGVFIYENPRIIKPFSLIDHHGKPFTNERLQKKWTLMFFGYTSCPDVCPTTMAMLKQMVEGIKDKNIQASTQVLMVTVDPARDTVDKMAVYVPYFNKDFTGITGDFLKIHAFATNLGAPFQKVPNGGDNYSVDHSGYIFLVNPRGDAQGFFRPPFSPDSFRQNYLSVREIYQDL